MTAIAVLGPGRAASEVLSLAAEVGRALARAGAVLVCGGLGGVMEAACRGAAEAGGLTVGILPGYDRDAANPFVRLAIPTGLGHARNAVVAAAGEAAIAVDGEAGTLAEIGLAVKIGRPVVLLATAPLDPAWFAGGTIERASTAAEAVERALALVTSLRR